MKIDFYKVTTKYFMLYYGQDIYKTKKTTGKVFIMKESSIEIIENVVMQKITKRKFIQYPNV